MDKLPDNLHAVMALFLRDDKVRDVTFAESMHAIDDIRQLHKLGLLEDPDKQWGRYIATTEAGDDYRRAFFPTKDERIADLRTKFDALVQASDALIDEKEDEIYRMRNLLLWAQNVINGRGFLTHDQKRLMDEIKDVLTAPDDMSVEGDVDE